MPTLNWLNRNEAVTLAGRAPYRLLEAVPEMSYGSADAENMLIQGDNLDALKALLPYYSGRVKCIYIDPPYNTQSAFAHYDDNLEHSTWLTMMYPRLELLRELLREDGSIWISIDDNEGHYLKVICDEVFGRKQFIADITWRKRDGAPNDRKIGAVHDHILVWGKSTTSNSKKTVAEEKFNLMPRTEKADSQYRVFDEPDGPDERGAFRKIDTTANGKGGRFVESLFYPITNPYTGEQVWPRKGTCWRHSKEEMERLQKERRLFWGKNGTAKTPMRKKFAFEAKEGMTTPTIWNDVGLNQHASSEMEKIFGEKAAFETPKPEGLMKRIIEIATNQDDLILDSFLGSGTTAAVAHKMGRRYIGIEMGEHLVTHCVPRLRKVVDGEQGGISRTVDWQGGGGFRVYRLGETVFDETGQINRNVGFDTLAAHIWFTETHAPLREVPDSSFIGEHEGTGYYLLYNGKFRDETAAGGDVLNSRVLRSLPGFDGPKVVYGEVSHLGPERLKRERITFKQIPYDIAKR